MNKKSWVFLLVNFIITWGCWLSVIGFQEEPLSQKNPLFILYVIGGLGGPVIAAIVSLKYSSDKAERNQFFKSLIKVRVFPAWYAAILLIPLGLGVMPILIDSVMKGEFQQPFLEPYYNVLLILPAMIIGGGLEEVGWRGILLPELLKKYSIAYSTAIIALVWAAWHIPLWFIVGTAQYGSSFIFFILTVIGNTLLLSAVYVRTKSVLLCILLHALFNANSAYFKPISEPSIWTVPIAAILSLLICGTFFYFSIRAANYRYQKK